MNGQFWQTKKYLHIGTQLITKMLTIAYNRVFTCVQCSLDQIQLRRYSIQMQKSFNFFIDLYKRPDEDVTYF